MIKKILFIFCLSFASIGFSQEKSLEKLTAAPNPFQTSTNISFKSVKATNVHFVVKNILGKTIHKEVLKATKGANSILFSKGNLKAGIYIYSIQNEKRIISKRLVIK